MPHKRFLPSAELWHAAIYFYWVLMAYEWRRSCRWPVTYRLSPRSPWGFLCCPVSSIGASDIRAANWKPLATDESGAYYSCDSPRHVRDANVRLYLGEPPCVFCYAGLIWEQKECWERRKTKSIAFASYVFTSEGCIHQEEAESVFIFLLRAVMQEGEENSFCSVHFSEGPRFVCRCNLMSSGCS